MTQHGLAARLEGWMVENRPALDELMRSEGSQALHLEFIEAEGGVMPSREMRHERARAASVRAWLRHLARALEAELPAPGVAARLEQRFNPERLEALVLEAQAVTERRGRAHPDVDSRRDQLVAWMRLFAAGVGEELIGDGEGPAAGKSLATWWESQTGRIDEITVDAAAAWPAPEGGAQDGNPFGRIENDERALEAASVWAHIRVLMDGLEGLLASGPAATS